MEDLNLKLLCGGFHRCLPQWSSKEITNEDYYKIYFPTDGEASVKVENKLYKIQPGYAYFIDGHKLQAQVCHTYMSVYWLHFVPRSLFINKLLNSLSPFYTWNLETSILKGIDYRCIHELFDTPHKEKNNVLETAPVGLTCYITSFLLLLISDMLKMQQNTIEEIVYGDYEKLKAAIDFINDNYKRTLRLEEIASKTYLNPIYFLRLFKQNFKITPHQYILKKRLDEACSMLKSTQLSINDISQRLGFCNQFYFSKTFKNHLGKTPSEYRHSKFSP